VRDNIEIVGGASRVSQLNCSLVMGIPKALYRSLVFEPVQHIEQVGASRVILKSPVRRQLTIDFANFFRRQRD